MAKKKAVKKEVEERPEESAPSKEEEPQEVEPEESSKTSEQETPTDASVGTEEEVKTVPYSRFKEINDRNKELEARLESKGQPEPLEPPAMSNEIPQLDPDSKVATEVFISGKHVIIGGEVKTKVPLDHAFYEERWTWSMESL